VAAEAVKGLIGRLRDRVRSGEAGEDLACDYLRARGYQILERNFRCRSGEVDIVAREGSATVFVEVKDRRGGSHGEGFEAVTFGKRLRLIRAARLYAASKGVSEQPIRFYVVSIDRADGRSRVRHDQDAFDVDGG
jgi:putative endonuclease